MAKFRSNHSKQTKGSSGMIVKVGLFGAILGGLFFIFNYFTGAKNQDFNGDAAYESEYYLPSSASGQIVQHRFYTLSYSEQHEQAEWVAYILTRDQLERPWEKRTDNFTPDPKVKTKSATLADYKGSGYDRGHLVPAADMAFEPEAMQETFYMSNISPQSRNFNKGIWRELEELTRSWAKKNGRLYVICGPVLSMEPKGTIGDNEVSIPAAFYKVLLDLSEPEYKAIGFVLQNQVNFEPLYNFAVSVDYVEELTGIDFFPEMMAGKLEEELEGEYNLDLWEFSKKKFEQRLKRINQK